MKNITIPLIIPVLAALSPILVSPNVTKTVWIMCRYSEPKYIAWGIGISLLTAFWASRRMRRCFKVALIVGAVLPLWFVLFMAADSGYRNWQGSGNAPAEAYADTGPIFFLVAGWLPSWGIVYLLLLLLKRVYPQPQPLTQSTTSNPR